MYYGHEKAIRMPQRNIRFGVIDGQGHRASIWKCWASVGKGKNEVYLACRKLGGVIKASFHETGSWHIAFDAAAFLALFEESDRPPSRFPTKWSRPPGKRREFDVIFTSGKTPLTDCS